ncbi:hypothetical protein ACWN8V_07245 [Vagococcus elongatus]|uniref:Uncharacterized protein n=1 Tax=Vagococcus elongatus TaxID=180344 RepID=A0A430AVU3_9ENTE|nr:hypothetical protein [Vagococcus elongatus]RSU12177.1 hypothetical protein CBF29_06140 [Vagococcus elongatus]
MTRKRIDKDTEITVMSTVRNGSFHYSNKTGTVVIDLQENGDDDFIDFASLKQMSSRSKSILGDFELLITGVEDDDLTIEDVVRELRLDDGYKELASITGSKDMLIEQENVEKFLVECESEDLEKIMNSKKSKIGKFLIREAVYLHKEGILNDFNKMNIVAEAAGIKSDDVSSFWADVASSK